MTITTKQKRFRKESWELAVYLWGHLPRQFKILSLPACDIVGGGVGGYEVEQEGLTVILRTLIN